MIFFESLLQMSEPEWYVYCLESTSGGSYVGATVDPNRRLRQHNQEIKGGARATGRKVAGGEAWALKLLVGPFQKQKALQFEWRWKWFSRKCKGAPIERRSTALEKLLTEETWGHPSVCFF